MKISFSSKKTSEGGSENNIKVPYGAAKRVAPKLRWILILLLVATPFILFLGKICWDWFFITSPGMVWMEPITVNAVESGTIEKINFKRGDLVKNSDKIFEAKRKLPDSRLETIAMLEAERDAGNKLSNTPNQQLGVLWQNVAYYEQARNKIQSLVSKGAATKAELDLAENSLREARVLLSTAQMLNPLRAEQVEQSIEKLKGITKETFEISPTKTARISSILVAEGQSFSAGEPLAVIVDPSKIHIVTYVDPHDFEKIEVGKVATIKIIGSGRKIKATVEQTPVLADDVPGGISEKLYPVTMRGIQVFLKPAEELREDESIEGLPVTVNW